MAGIYLHIPFCKKRCIYCDFYSTTLIDKKEKYINALCKELETRKDYIQKENIETIYFGGGTPSLLSYKNFECIFKVIYNIYAVSPQAEITLEANPDDLTPQYITMLRKLPFNRLSIGIQTFNEKTLKILNRRHSAVQAIMAFKNCRSAGFDNISIDLIYGLPEESLSSWEEDLNQTIILRPEHISAYNLIYEKGTELWNLRKQHKVKESSEELSLQMFNTLIDKLLSANYEHYEISNFCLPDKFSKHNSSYWTDKKYLGCGPSAHSYDGQTRQWNIASLSEYIKGFEEGIPRFEIEKLNIYTQYNDFIITHIRTIWGIKLAELKNKFNEQLYKYCILMANLHIEQGTLEIKNDTIKLTRKGIFISDTIMSDLLWVEE